MATYLIVDLDVHDAETYAEYRRLVPALIARHGGEYLARGGDSEALEGDWTPHRMVLVAFADHASMRAFVDDPDYAPVRAIRHASATSRVIALDGID